MENFFTNTQVHGHPLIRCLIFLCFLFLGSFLFAQDQNQYSKKATKLYNKAKESIKSRDFEKGMELLKKSIEADLTYPDAHLLLAKSQEILGQTDSAYSSYQRYLTYSPTPNVNILEKTLEISHDRGDYSLMESYLEKYAEMGGEETQSIVLLNESLAFIKNQDFNNTLTITPLSKTINRFKLQYLPVFTVDGNTIFYTKRNVVEDDEDIVVSHFQNGSWNEPASISRRINTKSNEGACTISADGRTLIFTSCDRRDTYGSCDLYVTYKKGENWTWPKNMGKPINSRYWESQPSLSADGKKLYFASNRPGGQGGRDIWVTQKEGTEWLNPKNAGNQINSFKDEATPFIHQNGLSLFFSSDGHPALGGFDLFYVQTNDSLLNPINLGYPLNTYKDEVSLTISGDGQRGFFSKETQKASQILESEIVQFDFPDTLNVSPVYYLRGTIVDFESLTPLKAEISVISIKSNQPFYSISSDSIDGTYMAVLPAFDSLAFYVESKGYIYKDLQFFTQKNDLTSIDTFDIKLKRIREGETSILQNIYFDHDSYELDTRSISEIELMTRFLKENEKAAIQIEGHTDNTGSESYNMKLAELRAQSVHNTLIQNGIPAERLSFKGFGSQQPIKPNITKEDRQYNRRIEFRVLRMSQ